MSVTSNSGEVADMNRVDPVSESGSGIKNDGVPEGQEGCFIREQGVMVKCKSWSEKQRVKEEEKEERSEEKTEEKRCKLTFFSHHIMLYNFVTLLLLFLFHEE